MAVSWGDSRPSTASARAGRGHSVVGEGTSGTGAVGEVATGQSRPTPPSAFLTATAAARRSRDPGPAVADLPPRADRMACWGGPVTDQFAEPVPGTGTAAVWVLGVHGGAGATTVATLLPDAADANRLWPDPAFGGPRGVLMVSRVSALGLRKLRMAVRQWAAHGTSPLVELVGAVGVAAEPGRPARPLLDELDQLRRIVPAVAVLPWRPDLIGAVMGPGEPVPAPLRLFLPAPPAGAGSRVGAAAAAVPGLDHDRAGPQGRRSTPHQA